MNMYQSPAFIALDNNLNANGPRGFSFKTFFNSFGSGRNAV